MAFAVENLQVYQKAVDFADEILAAIGIGLATRPSFVILPRRSIWPQFTYHQRCYPNNISWCCSCRRTVWIWLTDTDAPSLAEDFE